MDYLGYISRYKRVGIFFLTAFLCFPAIAQDPERTFLELETTTQGVLLNTNDGQYRFVAYTPQILETSFVPEGEEYDTLSHAVVLEPSAGMLEIREEEERVFIHSGGISVEIVKSPFQIIYHYKEEKLISEKAGFSEGEEHQKIDFNITEEEFLFGGGARALGMNRRGNRLELYNKAHYGYEETSELLNYSIPIVISSEKYLLHFDNAPIGFLDLDSKGDNTLAYETISGRKTYQIVTGDTWEDIVENYTLLTGRQPMPPRWAFGNFSSRFGYHSQREVEETIERFKEDSIPVDAVILDVYWFGHEIKGTMGNLEFVRDSFPEPEKMMANLQEKGVKTILVTEPFILTTSNRWDEAVAENVLATDASGEPFTFDFYFGNSGIIDIFKPEARLWFWNIYRELSEMGVDGWWGDLGEPEMHPAELQHVAGSASEVHNIYGHYWAKLIYDGYREDFSQNRPFILMRAGAAGSQRFGLIPWSGDVNRSWGGLRSQPEIAIQMGMQGLAYMHSDLGGFAGDLADDELYIRWLQYGVFQPVFRPHAQEEVAAEPVFKAEPTKKLAREAIELRYRLLPYNYTLAHENSQKGVPLMRPLFFEESENEDLYTVANTYLWGKDLLISPILEKGIKEQDVYFPSTANWYDAFTNKRFTGGSTQTVAVVEEHIPTFVRGGAFIPMAKPMETTAEYSASTLEVHFYFDEQAKESEGYVYHDDGASPQAFENGMYEIVRFSSKLGNNEVTLEVTKETGDNFTEEIQEVEIFVLNLEREVEFVWVNGIKYTGKNYRHRDALIIPVTFGGDSTNIRIEYR